MARVKIGNVRTPIDYLKQHFAPVGYGLGVSLPRISADANAATKNGWYLLEPGATNSPNSTYYAVVRADSVDDGSMVQTAYSLDAYFSQLIRRKIFGTWGEWEYVNPPMVIGVEYRTTERWNGKPVYRKLVSFNLAAATSSGFVVPHGISGFKRLVRQVGTFDPNFLLPYIHNGHTTWVSEVNATNIVVGNTGQAWDTSYSWHFDLYYTKN